MSVQTLYTAATGMQSLKTKLDVIANNLANVNAVAFKKDRANFEDLFYRNETVPGSQTNGRLSSTGIQIGLGLRGSGIQSKFTQGAFQLTGGQLDVVMEGNGFFVVEDHQLLKGDIIRLQDIRLRPARSASEAKRGHRDLKGVVGMEMTRDVSPGEVVEVRHTRRTILVRRGELVEVTARAPGVQVTAKGRAMHDGGHGDLVMTQSATDRKQRYSARVVGVMEVEVLAQSVGVK